MKRFLTRPALASVTLAVVLGLSACAASPGEAQQDQPLAKYPNYPPTATVAPPPASQAQPASANVLFSDSFASDASLKNWTFPLPSDAVPVDEGGNIPRWAVAEGALVQKNTDPVNNPDFMETMGFVGSNDWKDYTITAKIYDFNGPTFGLVVRRQGNSYYRWRAIASDRKDTPKQVLEKVVNGQATTLVEVKDKGYEHRVWNVVSLSVKGNTIRVTLNGAVVAEATDTALTSGQAGIYTRAVGGARFDDVQVTTP